MSKARCKFTLVSATPQGEDSLDIVLSAQYDQNDPEDTKFSKYTPWGELKFGVSNPAVLPLFQGNEGKVFYVDITPVSDEE